MCACMQSERVQLDEQARLKDIELNRLKSVKIELEQDLRDCRQTVDRVSHSCHLVCTFSIFFNYFPLSLGIYGLQCFDTVGWVSGRASSP